MTLALCVVLLLLCVGNAAAQGAAVPSLDERAARVHFEAGEAYFARGEYEAAAREFDAAYALSRRVPLLYNLYLSYERLGSLEEAADALRSFLAQSPDAANRPQLEARLQSLERRVAEHEEAQAAERERAAAEQAQQRAAAEAAVAAERGREATTERESLGAPAWAAIGIGAAGIATFAVAGGLALAEDRSLADSCGEDAGRVCSDAEVQPLWRRTITADVGLAVGLAGAATGLLLALLPRRGDEPARVAVSPAVASGFIGGELRGGF